MAPNRPRAGGQGGPSQRVMLVVNMAALVAMLNALRQSAPLLARDVLMEASLKAEREFKQGLRAKAHVDVRL